MHSSLHDTVAIRSFLGHLHKMQNSVHQTILKGHLYFLHFTIIVKHIIFIIFFVHSISHSLRKSRMRVRCKIPHRKKRLRIANNTENN